MSKPRSTVQLRPLAEHLQVLIGKTTDADARQGLCLLLENLLHETNNYKGFTFFNTQNENTIVNTDPGQENYWRRFYFGLNDIGRS